MLSRQIRFAGLIFLCAGAICAQTLTITGVVNAASLAPGISPGAAAIVQGAGFSGDAT